MRVVIVGGGSVSESVLTAEIKREGAETAYVIAADAGVAPLLQIKVLPDYVVGDFDSLPDKGMLQEIEEAGIRLRTLNPIKDDTDMESAMHYAYDLHPEEIVLLGATGTRLDHVLGNLQLLKQAAEQGIRAEIVDATNRVRLVTPDFGPFAIRRADQYGKYISVLPFTDSITVSMSGFFYPLDHETLTRDNTLGVSNELTGDGVITVHEGEAIVIESRD